MIRLVVGFLVALALQPAAVCVHGADATAVIAAPVDHGVVASRIDAGPPLVAAVLVLAPPAQWPVELRCAAPSVCSRSDLYLVGSRLLL